MRLSYTQEYRALLFVAHLMRALPRRLALALGGVLGWLGWYLGIRRELVLRNLKQALPHLSPDERRRLAVRSASNFVRTGVEFVRFDGRDRDRLEELVSLNGTDELRAALEEGGGAIVVTAHLGAWALYVTALAAAGLPTALLVGRQHNPQVDRFIHRIPGEAVSFISKGRSAPREILRNLKKGHGVVMVADQNSGRRGTLAPFLGRETSTLPLPGALVARYRVPLFFMAGHRVAGGRHEVKLRRLETPSTECGSCLRRQVATLANQAIAQAVLEHPDQYFWYHRRFRESDAELTAACTECGSN